MESTTYTIKNNNGSQISYTGTLQGAKIAARAWSSGQDRAVYICLGFEQVAVLRNRGKNWANATFAQHYPTWEAAI